jgi:hypothetical protein
LGKTRLVKPSLYLQEPKMVVTRIQRTVGIDFPRFTRFGRFSVVAERQAR